MVIAALFVSKFFCDLLELIVNDQKCRANIGIEVSAYAIFDKFDCLLVRESPFVNTLGD